MVLRQQQYVIKKNRAAPDEAAPVKYPVYVIIRNSDASLGCRHRLFLTPAAFPGSTAFVPIDVDWI